MEYVFYGVEFIIHKGEAGSNDGGKEKEMGYTTTSY
jgi:hypothetical protein